MVYVNWKKILENPPRPALRDVLCSGDLKLLKSLYVSGFTEYFTEDCSRMITQEHAIEMFRGGVLNSTLDSFLINYPVPYFLFDVIGFKVGNALSFPLWLNEKENKFIQSYVAVGREVVYEKINYIVLFNQFHPDPVQKPMFRYQFLAVPKAVFPLPAGTPVSFDEIMIETSQG